MRVGDGLNGFHGTVTTCVNSLLNNQPTNVLLIIAAVTAFFLLRRNASQVKYFSVKIELTIRIGDDSIMNSTWP